MMTTDLSSINMEASNINKVLLTTHHLKNFAGSELVTADLFSLFKEKYSVKIATFFYDHPFKSHFENLGNGDQIINLLNQNLSDQSFDLVWSHHFPISFKTLVEENVKFKYLILSSLSPYEPLESIQLFGNQATAILCNSYETRDKLATYLNWKLHSKLYIFPNSVPYSWFKSENRSKRQKPRIERVAVVSNHIPKELFDLREHIQGEGYVCDFIGYQEKFEIVNPSVLNQYDLVITIGRTVQHCMALKLPVYCYDHFGGPGWITEENIQEAEYYNYSGRCCNRKLNASALWEEILVGYPISVENLDVLFQYAKEHYCLQDNVGRLFAKFKIDLDSSVPLKNINLNESQKQRFNFLSQLYTRTLLELEQSQGQLDKTQDQLKQTKAQLERAELKIQILLKQSQGQLDKTQDQLKQTKAQLERAEFKVSALGKNIFWQMKKKVLKVFESFFFN